MQVELPVRQESTGGHSRGFRWSETAGVDDARGAASRTRADKTLAGPSGGFVTGETLTVDGGSQLWGETWTTGKPPYFGGESG